MRTGGRRVVVRRSRDTAAIVSPPPRPRHSGLVACLRAPIQGYSDAVPVHLVDHPLAHDTLVRLRDVRTTSDQYRELTRHISFLLLAEATRDLPTRSVTVQTPVAAAQGHELNTQIVVVPVLRAGLGMLDAVLALVPRARVGHIGLQRDESTAIASKY